MQVTIEKTELRRWKRVLAVSDVHGHGHLLKRLLTEAHFSPEDALIIVGDIVEKGPDSLGTLRYVMELAKRPNVFPLIGNVDLWRLSLMKNDSLENQQEVIQFSQTALKWWGGSLVGEMMAEMGLDMEKDGKEPGLFEKIRLHFEKELAFLSSLPTVLEAEQFYFVHGGLPHERLSELAGKNPYSLLKNDDFLHQGLTFQKWLVVGHWPVALYNNDLLQHGPVIEPQRRILSIDGGCGVRGDGQLNLLITDWEAKEFAHLSATDKEKIMALDGQEKSTVSRNIPWHDPVVELVEKEEKWARVKHHGYEMRIPIHFLKADNGQWKCYNLTDYRLPVEPGDVLQLIFEHDGRTYCKKNDVCGWYEGRYRMIKETEA